jgi:hypothetical protein
MNTESRRRASATYHAKRAEAGLKKVTLWLGPDARDKLEALREVYGSKDAAAEAAILALSEGVAPQQTNQSGAQSGADQNPSAPAEAES